MDNVCTNCVHADVCKHREKAEALILTIMDLRETEEMKTGAFKIYMKCRFYISTAVAQDFEERR